MPRVAAPHADTNFETEMDLDTLRRAGEILADEKRLKKVQALAKKQRAGLDKIVESGLRKAL